MEAAYGKWGYYLLSLLQFMYPFLGEYSVLFRGWRVKVVVGSGGENEREQNEVYNNAIGYTWVLLG